MSFTATDWADLTSIIQQGLKGPDDFVKLIDAALAGLQANVRPTSTTIVLAAPTPQSWPPGFDSSPNNKPFFSLASSGIDALEAAQFLVNAEVRAKAKTAGQAAASQATQGNSEPINSISLFREAWNKPADR